VNQAADSKESIQLRHDILFKHLVEFDKAFSQFMKKDEIERRLTALEKENEISNLSYDIFGLMGECNTICTSEGQSDIFKVTNTVLKRISDVDMRVETKSSFCSFMEALYEIIYEGSGSLSRIPDSLKGEDSVLLAIKFIRADIRHDLEHGSQKEIQAKKQRLAGIYRSYTGKTSLDAIGDDEFLGFQIKILENLRSLLIDLKKYCVEDIPKSPKKETKQT
jgi:hypothetical protein